MTWFRLDDKGAFHAKVIAAGNEAYGAWCRAGQWSSDHSTDGRIPTATAHLIASRRVWKKMVEAIPAGHTVGLATQRADGYEIHDYLAYNPSADDVRADRESRSEVKRKAGRQGGLQSGRVRRSDRPAEILEQAPSDLGTRPCKTLDRANLRDGLRVCDEKPNDLDKSAKQKGKQNEAEGQAERKQNEAPIPIPIPIPKRSEIPEPVVEANEAPRQEPERPRLTAFEEPFWKAAYVESVRSILHGSWSFPDRQTRSIRSAIEGHCRNYADIDAWLRAKVIAFVAATRERSTYYAGLGPDGFLKWLNEESAKAPARTGRVVCPAEDVIEYPPPTPEEAAELAQALRNLVEPPPEAKSGVRAVIGDDLSPAEVERLETKRRELVAALRSTEAPTAEVHR